MEVPNQIIQQITTKVEIERIYQFSYHFLDKEYHRLLIVLGAKCGVSPAILEPTIDICLDEAKDLTYMLITSGDLKTAIKSGNLFYTITCQEKNLCYHDGIKPIANTTKEELELIKINKSSLFCSSQTKASDFKEGMQFYTQKGNLHQAAFMLHQATEQTIRGVLHAVFNKDKPSHSLEAHLATACRFIPAIAILFSKKNQYDYSLLQLLDKAYTTVRYKNNFVIEEEQLADLTSKIELLSTWSNTFFKECLDKLEELFEKEEQLQNMVKPDLPTGASTEQDNKEINIPIIKNVLNEIQSTRIKALINKVCKEYPVLQIKLLGIITAVHQTNSIYSSEQIEDQSVHCYMYVILKGSQDVRSYTINQGDLKITLLIHHEREIEYALKRHNRFFINALQKGAEIYRRVNHPIQFIIPEPDWKHSLKSANHFFENRLERLADMFLESAKHIYQEVDGPVTEACLLLLTHCIEQVCISYIYINTGYRVNNHNLSFLFDLCGLIDADILNVLQLNTDVGKRHKEALINCVQYIRNKSKCSLSHEDFVILSENCKKLVDVVKNNCETEINRLRNLVNPKDESKLNA